MYRGLKSAIAFTTRLVLARRATHAVDALDFAVVGPGDRLAEVELKADHQPYRGWGRMKADHAPTSFGP